MAATHVSPFVLYHDPIKALDWLKSAFGVEEHAVYKDEQGNVVHGEIKVGESIVMFAGAGEPNDLNFKTAREAGAVTATIYANIDAIDEHYERSRRAGARILREIKDQDYGSRDYTVLDLEDNLWSFGTYDPFHPPVQNG